MAINIENCIFKFKCTKSWKSLLQTSDRKIRYCEECDRGVHLCKTDRELEIAKSKGWCVAVKFKSEEEKEKELEMKQQDLLDDIFSSDESSDWDGVLMGDIIDE